jgi:hypothetical protein
MLLDSNNNEIHYIFERTLEEVLSLSIQYCTGLRCVSSTSEFIRSFNYEAEHERICSIKKVNAARDNSDSYYRRNIYRKSW